MDNTKEEKNGAKLLGRSIGADLKSCHGQLTLRGTRLFVEEVREQVSSGRVWEAMIEEWHGHITKKAVAEAMQLANHVLLKESEASDGSP